MDDSRTDAPEFELTPHPPGEVEGPDALQLNAADAAGLTGVPVALAPAAAALVAAVAAADVRPLKAARPVTAAANDSVVAALMGRSIAKLGKSAKPSPTTPTAIPNAEAVLDAAFNTAEPPLAAGAGPIIDAGDAEEPVAALTIQTIALPEPAMASAGGVGAAAVIEPSSGFVGTVPATKIAAPVAPLLETPVAVAAAPAITPIVANKVVPPLVPLPVPAVASAAAASTAPPAPKPKRAIPVAPVWPSEPAPVARASAPLPPVSPIFALTSAAVEAPESVPPARSTGAWWTLPLMFVGIAIVACAVLVPAADENRRDLYELTKIERDVAYFKAQSDVNVDFLQRVNTDPTLAERLAMRQLHQTLQGTKIARIAGRPDRYAASPYAMTRLDPPAPLAPYQPVPDRFSEWFLGDQRPQQMASLGLLIAGAGVLIGGIRKRPEARGLRA